MSRLRIFRSLEEARQGFPPSAVTIGNFDGVHAGHRELMRRTVRLALELGVKPSALTFHPHPATVVAPERIPRLLSTPDERCALMAAEGIEQVLIMPFDESISHLSPEEFFRRVLVVPYSGEARAAYLHCFDGGDGEAQRAIQDALGADYVVLRTKDAVAAGLFGTGQPAPESLARLGHLFVIPRGAHYLDRRNLRRKLRGRHGGLSPEEMLVPWLAARLDA